MGRELSRQMAARGDQLFLLGRDQSELQKSASDLVVRSARRAGAQGTGVQGAGVQAAVGLETCDLARPEQFAYALGKAAQALGGIDVIVVTAALFASQERLEQDRALAEQLLTIDFTNTILFCETAKDLLLKQGGGTLCVFSSVAGDRGRGKVTIYGAAKAGLTHYLEGLDSRHHRDGLRVVCVKPGFVRTSMTHGLPETPFASDPDAVAAVVLRAIDSGRPVIYATPIWRWVMMVIRWLPRFVMRRVKF